MFDPRDAACDRDGERGRTRVYDERVRADDARETLMRDLSLPRAARSASWTRRSRLAEPTLWERSASALAAFGAIGFREVPERRLASQSFPVGTNSRAGCEPSTVCGSPPDGGRATCAAGAILTWSCPAVHEWCTPIRTSWAARPCSSGLASRCSPSSTTWRQGTHWTSSSASFHRYNGRRPSKPSSLRERRC